MDKTESEIKCRKCHTIFKLDLNKVKYGKNAYTGTTLCPSCGFTIKLEAIDVSESFKKNYDGSLIRKEPKIKMTKKMRRKARKGVN